MAASDSKSNFPKANKEIRALNVRLVDEQGNMLGVVGIREARMQAEKAGLDLVEISPNAAPPVCKILDFGKYKYEIKKRLHDAKKKQKVTVIKEMKFKLNIGQGDFEVKLRKIKDFLNESNKVKITLALKGREIVHKEVGMRLFDKISASLEETAKIELEPKMEGKQIIMIVSPILK